LHGKQQGGTYGFMAPSAHHRIGATLLPLWERARSILEEADDLVPVSALYDAWTGPPFGIRRGLLPILALALVQAHRTSIAIYAEGTFQPELGDFVADLLLQNANLIQLRKVNLQGQNEQILGDLARAIAEIAETAPSVEPLAVARALVRFVFRLPPWTRKTGSLSRHSEAVRRILLNASDPHRVIFIDMPLLFEGTPAAELGLRIGEALRELADAYPRMLDDLRARMLNALGQKPYELIGLRRRAQIVSGLSGDLRLDAFAARLSDLTDAQSDMEAIASFAINKPIRDWTDRDPDQAALALADLALKFRHAELLSRVKGREPSQHAVGVVFGTGERGRTVMETFDISEEEQAEVAELGERVANLLRRSGAKHRLLLAALAQAGTRTIEDAAERALEPPKRAAAS
jgi:hypothetical protein